MKSYMMMQMSEEKEKITFFRRVWKSGKTRLLIKIPPEHAEHYNLEGKFVKVTLEILGEWKLHENKDAKKT